MTKKIEISPAVVEWVDSVVDKTKLEQREIDLLSSWTAGSPEASFDDLSAFSKKSRIPLGYFFLETPPKEKIDLMKYRTVDSAEFKNPSYELIDIYFTMTRFQERTIDDLEQIESSPLSFVGALRDCTDPDRIIESIRELLELDRYPIFINSNKEIYADLRDRIRGLGVLVYASKTTCRNDKTPLNFDEFKGFALTDSRAPLIFVNWTENPAQNIYTLIHEFVYVCLGQDDLFNKNDRSPAEVKPIEIPANQAAVKLFHTLNVYSVLIKNLCSHTAPED